MFFVGDVMKHGYEIEKNVDKIKRGGYTDFIAPNIYKDIVGKLKKVDYCVYYPYPDSEKVILYTNEIPVVRLFEIISYSPLTHSMIMGSLFGLNIKSEVIGDIIINDDKYYFYVTDKIGDFIKNNLLFVGSCSVKVKEIDIDVLRKYHRRYEEKEIIVSSLRIDNVISKIIATNRDKVKEKIKDKEVFLNYEVVTNGSYILKNDDVFSIRSFGKYKFVGVVKMTKKDNYIVKYFKYL